MIDKHPSRYKQEKSTDKLSTSRLLLALSLFSYISRQPKPLERAPKLKNEKRWMLVCVSFYHPSSHIYRRGHDLLGCEVKDEPLQTDRGIQWRGATWNTRGSDQTWSAPTDFNFGLESDTWALMPLARDCARVYVGFLLWWALQPMHWYVLRSNWSKRHVLDHASPLCCIFSSKSPAHILKPTTIEYVSK